MFFKLKILYYFLQFRISRWMFRDEPEALQKKRWREQRRFLQRSAFYSGYTDEKSFNQFPVINKAVFMREFDSINTCGMKLKDAMEFAIRAEQSRDFSNVVNGITVGLSSGTSGNRGLFLASENERARWVAAVLDRVIGFEIKKRKVAFFLRANSNLYESVNSSILKFLFYDLLIPVSDHVENLNVQNPDILVGQPDLLLELSGFVLNGKLKIQPDKIISVAEVLHPEDRTFLETVFNQKIHQVYQCTEGFLASTCKEGTLHFHEDFLIIEKKYLDEEKKRFHPVITDLFRKSQPVIRYELNDIIIEKQDCPCGNPSLAVESIEGRSDDCLQFLDINKKEIRIFPDFFRRAVLLGDETCSDYMVVQNRPGQLKIYLGRVNQTAEAKVRNEMKVLLEKFSVFDYSIEFTDEKPHTRGQKLRRIKNECL